MENFNTEDIIWILMARKLSGEASAAEIAELDLLLRNNPNINYSKEILYDLWQSGIVTDSHYTESKYKELLLQLKSLGADTEGFEANDHFINSDEIPAQSSRFSKKLVLGILGVAVLAVAAYLVFLNQSTPSSAANTEQLAKNEVSTQKGSRTSLQLPDGTKVWLNAGSKLEYDKNFGNNNREVTLNGEAYFDVVKNAAKPFIIHTSKMDIKVLGTVFNVKCYPNEKTYETSLIHGSIEVTLKDRQEKIIMKPNEKMVLNTEDLSPITTKKSNPGAPLKSSENPRISLGYLTIIPEQDSLIAETAWVQNRLVFNGDNFEDIALKMERWYGVDIDFADEEVKRTRYTVIFDKESISEALYAMQLAKPFLYTLKNNHVTIYRK
jgi:ferric-dicitrate binding protein FerR (iron transport regulator)